MPAGAGFLLGFDGVWQFEFKFKLIVLDSSILIVDP